MTDRQWWRGGLSLVAALGVVAALGIVGLVLARSDGGVVRSSDQSQVLARPTGSDPTGPLFDMGPPPSFTTSWAAPSLAARSPAGIATRRPAGPLAGRFDPGNIISDQVFYDASAMSEQEIRAFIAAKGAACNGDECLKNRRWTMDPAAADQFCAAFPGGSDLDAAAILSQLSSACGINPQVMLVTLQKESSLLDRPDPVDRNYDAAFGWHCPDVDGAAACDPAYGGFVTQATGMAKQWSRYRNSPGDYRYQAGRTYDIAWDVDPQCGSAPVTIRNTATASLYNYTPYQPNAAALASYPGEGDSCSAYGIRNFYFLFGDYFGGGAAASTGSTP